MFRVYKHTAYLWFIVWGLYVFRGFRARDLGLEPWHVRWFGETAAGYAWVRSIRVGCLEDQGTYIVSKVISTFVLAMIRRNSYLVYNHRY